MTNFEMIKDILKPDELAIRWHIIEHLAIDGVSKFYTLNSRDSELGTTLDNKSQAEIIAEKLNHLEEALFFCRRKAFKK